MEQIYHFLLTNTNRDCLNNIHKFMFPSKKQLFKWKIIHNKKTICNHCMNLNFCRIHKRIYLYNCCCKNNYISVIKKVGDFYNYFKSYKYFKILLQHNNHYKTFFHYIKYQIYI